MVADAGEFPGRARVEGRLGVTSRWTSFVRVSSWLVIRDFLPKGAEMLGCEGSLADTKFRVERLG